MNAAQARRNVERQIARNPSSIVIQRMREVDDGAGGSYRETVGLPAQTVRIGRSPRMRGSPALTLAVEALLRSIPAHAG